MPMGESHRSPQERGRGSGLLLPHAAAAMNARQPPNSEMSRAPLTASASTRKPCTAEPSAKRMVPIDSGEGIAATKAPNEAGDSAQISTSIDEPAPASMRSM